MGERVMRTSLRKHGVHVVGVSTLLLVGCAGSQQAEPIGSKQPVTQTLSIANGQNITVTSGDSVQLSASYGNGRTPAHLQWLVIGGGGAISASGIYSAPLSLPTDPRTTISVKDVDTGQSASTTINLVNPVPVVKNLTPASLSPGIPTSITITGSHFVPDSAATVDGTSVTTTYISPSTLALTVSVPAFSKGDHVLGVITSSPGGGTSNSVRLPVTAPKISYDAAARFLQQATWGATPATIQHVQSVGFAKFIDEQLQAPPQSNVVDNDANHFQEVFWAQLANNDATQLRTKTAWAWYKIFNSPGGTVLSMLTAVPETINRDAFLTYEQLFSDVAFNITIGMYLSYCCNDEAGPQPDENFARESMQVFSVGPYLLRVDGTKVEDSQQIAKPAYTSADVEAIAQAVTGLTYPSDVWNNNDTQGLIKMTSGPSSQHAHNSKIILGQTIPAGQDAAKDLSDVIHILSNHPNTGIRLSKYLIHQFVTSNPSPEYVARVSRIWAKNEKGVKGDIPSVIKAILLDPEARAGDDGPSSVPPPAVFGRFRDTINFATGFVRGLSAIPNASVQPGSSWQLSIRTHEMTFFAPSVFGYYSDNFTVPNTDILAPEMQIYTSDSITARASYLKQVIYCTDGSYSKIDWTPWMQLAEGDGSQLVDLLNHVYFHGTMSPELARILKNNLGTIGDLKSRAQQTLYLALLSPEYAVER
jgi:uncharacterized protein (DUF1800 family)